MKNMLAEYKRVLDATSVTLSRFMNVCVSAAKELPPFECHSSAGSNGEDVTEPLTECMCDPDGVVSAPVGVRGSWGGVNWVETAVTDTATSFSVGM